MTELSEKLIAEQRQFIELLPAIVDKALKLGLFRTHHALKEAQNKADYELAVIIEKHQFQKKVVKK